MIIPNKEHSFGRLTATYIQVDNLHKVGAKFILADIPYQLWKYKHKDFVETELRVDLAMLSNTSLDYIAKEFYLTETELSYDFIIFYE